jgi:hypothetical protein
MTASIRRRPGEVRDAIVTYLADHKRDATVADIRTAVEAALGAKVAASSVRSYLQLNTGSTFRRTGRGRYRLSVK